MAVVERVQACNAFTISGASPFKLTFPEAASQSFKAGEAVYLNNGKVTVCANNATTILGFAVADATGITDADCEVFIATGDLVLEMNVYHGTAASAVTAITQPGTLYAIEVVDNKVYCAIDEEGADAVVVIGLSPRDNVGDQYGRVLVQVVGAARQLGGIVS